MNPKISIAVPTYNSAAYIGRLLTYAVQQEPYAIYVLDDASTDNTVAICKQFPEVEIIAGTKNIGPTRNRNRVLPKDLGDIVVFIDDDMRHKAGDLTAAIQMHFSDPKIGALGFAIFSTSDKELWFGNERESNPLFFWALHPFITHLQPTERQQSFLPVQWVLEGAFAVRSDLFKSLGGFDERFKRYQEGPDLCRRIRQQGYIVGYTHDVQFTHTKPLSVFSPHHAGRYLKSGARWHIKHRGKLKPKQ
jgi:GT2 family glycosyltransferase